LAPTANKYKSSSDSKETKEIKEEKYDPLEDGRSCSDYNKSGPRSLLTPDKSQVYEFATKLYKQSDERTRTRALLAHVYYLAVHNRFGEARDLLLMSHIQDVVSDADTSTRILFNRAMAQVGLCAFRVGDYRQSLQCLSELYSANKERMRELLAQGVSIFVLFFMPFQSRTLLLTPLFLLSFFVSFSSSGLSEPQLPKS
jgi:hypothetical protein